MGLGNHQIDVIGTLQICVQWNQRWLVDWNELNIDLHSTLIESARVSLLVWHIRWHVSFLFLTVFCLKIEKGFSTFLLPELVVEKETKNIEYLMKIDFPKFQ